MQNQAYQQQQGSGGGGAYGAIGSGVGMLGGAFGGRYLGKKILAMFDDKVVLEDGSVKALSPSEAAQLQESLDAQMAGTQSNLGVATNAGAGLGAGIAANAGTQVISAPITMAGNGMTAGSVQMAARTPTMLVPESATIAPAGEAGTLGAGTTMSTIAPYLQGAAAAYTAYEIGKANYDIMKHAYGGVDTKRREKETIAALMARSIDPAWQNRVNLLHERDLTEGLDPALLNGEEYNFEAIRPRLKGSDLTGTAGFLRAVGPSSYTPEQEAAIAQAYLDRGLVRSDAGNIEFGGVLPEVNKGIIDAAIAGKAIPDFKLIPGRGLVDVNEHPDLLEEARTKKHNLLGGLWSYGQQRRGELPWMYSGTPAVKSVMSEAPVAPAQPGQTSIIGPSSVVPIPPANVSGAAPQIVISVPGSPTELPALRPEDRVTYPWAPV